MTIIQEITEETTASQKMEAALNNHHLSMRQTRRVMVRETAKVWAADWCNGRRSMSTQLALQGSEYQRLELFSDADLVSHFRRRLRVAIRQFHRQGYCDIMGSRLFIARMEFLSVMTYITLKRHSPTPTPTPIAVE